MSGHKVLQGLLIVFLLASFSGCKKEVVTVPSVTFDYFPTAIGTWREYVCDSVFHADNDNNNDDSVYSSRFYLREIIDSNYIDIEGRRVEIIKRYRRSDTLSTWNILNIWTQRLSTVSAYRVEENINLHKLAFPINSSVIWNSNDANTFDEEPNQYEYFHEPGIFNNMNFDSTLSVIQINDNNYISRQFGNEIYATGVGLIYKERDELGKRNGVVVSGTEFKMVITAYGK
jgi:hypothetical protein